MPAYNGNPNDWLFNFLRGLERQINALQTQQNWGITDASGHLRIRAGLQPDQSFGIEILDDTGNVRVVLGDLPTGDYGMSVTDPLTSTTTEFLPVYIATTLGTLAVTSGTTHTAWITRGGPSVEAVVGSSGKCILSISAFCSVGTRASTTERGAWISVGIDGAAPTGSYAAAGVESNSSGTAVGATAGISYLVKSLSPGKHTFKLWYKAQLTTPKFATRLIQVQPV